MADTRVSTRSPRFKDITGQTFGRLTAVECLGPYRAKPASEPKLKWRCLCQCGAEVEVVAQSLRNGLTKSCGCYNRQNSAIRRTTHGRSKSPEYRSWRHAIERCTDPKNRAWKDYGGRGIRVCGEWLHDFAAFFAHIGPKPSPRHTIDRIDNDGHYEPGNVRWATPHQQVANRRPLKRRTHCIRGHELTEDNIYKNGRGYRWCMECRRIRDRQRRPPGTKR